MKITIKLEKIALFNFWGAIFHEKLGILKFAQYFSIMINVLRKSCQMDHKSALFSMKTVKLCHFHFLEAEEIIFK